MIRRALVVALLAVACSAPSSVDGGLMRSDTALDASVVDLCIPPTPSVTDCSLANVRCVPSEHPSIQACATAAQPGDTCLIAAGLYDERVAIATSGTAGMPIRFEGDGRVRVLGFDIYSHDYITLSGLELTTAGMTPERFDSAAVLVSTSHHVTVSDCCIHDTSATCLRIRPQDGLSNFFTARHNIITHCGALSSSAPGIGIDVYGDDALVEDNDIFRIGEDFTRFAGGEHDVLRNNHFHDNANADWEGSATHIDGMQHACAAGFVPLRHSLIENNLMTTSPDDNTHFVIYQDYGPCGEADTIIRYNTVSDLGSGFIVNDRAYRGVRAYNNTAVRLGSAQMPRPWQILGFTDGASEGMLFNNIFVDTVRNGGGVYLTDGTTMDLVAHDNLAWNTECTTTCTWTNPPDAISSEPGAVLDQDPMFTNAASDFTLRAGSPAIGAGGALTTAMAAGASSTSLTVAQSALFQDGWAGTEGDWIAVGNTTNVAQVMAIDDATDTLTLSAPLTWDAGASVWLARDSSGRQVLDGGAPNIGAH